MSLDSGLGKTEVASDFIGLKMPGDPVKAETLFVSERVFFRHNTSPIESVT